MMCCVVSPVYSNDDLPGGGQATTVDSIALPPGFRAQLLRSAKKGEGSWISMTFDNRGRVVLGRDKRGVVRLSLSDDRERVDRFEVIEDTLKHCRGILWAHDSLYVCATNASGFYRLRDTNGDDQFDSVEELKAFDYQSRYGHGPNQVVLGPDNMLYIVNGNDVAFPEGFAVDSPYRDPQDDHLLPESRDAVPDIRVGYVAKTDPKGKNWEIIAGGFRNQFDVAFNDDGEMFTYDADMEWDVGLPWYRPTRLNHVVSGGEYGWRWGTGKWPEYFADSLPTTLDTGLGSPTGLEFGTRSHFPPGYRESLFMGDWQHGRIFQVQLTPRGASYDAEYKVFLEGGALNVCDLTFGPDGAMYFITGGRGSQSGLYRVTYDGPDAAAISLTPQQADQAQQATSARQLRHQLEQWHSKRDANAIDVAWPHLDSEDRWLRFAARLAIERQDPALWRERALSESRPTASIAALLALARLGRAEDQPELLAALDRLPLRTLGREQLLDALRVWQLSFIRQGHPSESDRAQVLARLSPLYPQTSSYVNRELCGLLIYLQAPNVVPRTVELIRTAISQEDVVFYSQRLARVAEGWTAGTRESFFDSLLAARRYQGGKLLSVSLQHIHEDAIATLTDAEQKHLKPRLDMLALATEESGGDESLSASFVKQWTWEELETELPRTRHGRSWEQGRAALAKAQCMKCHRVSEQGSPTGPDLTHVGRRFDEHALLESIVQPSKVIDEKYRLSTYVLDSGQVITGRPIGVSATVITVQTDSLRAETVAIKRAEIEQTSPASLSLMPSGLMDVLTLDEILDLIAYLKSGGNPQADVYQEG
ncbi:Cytochrome c [Novipirellula galeiformis]|uniref:Cytochrome c n=2 Tax=Novipirellula galeiformis TaxID=2528004 RepID=A0A5C6CT92_9BACT|nr:Cytochrome c [Novipirellula galeiformis]